MTKEKVIAIVGPTAVGKTTLAIHLAQKLGGEIISGDSQQVYKGLDIGTAKATKREQQQALHHLIDTKEINDAYDVHQFKTQANALIQELTSRGKLPIICGGTGLYIQSLLEDYSLGGCIEAGVQEKYERLLQEKGKTALWEALREVDKEASEKIHENNTRRMIRALVVLKCTGKSILSVEKDGRTSLYRAKIIGLNTDRALLYARINERVDRMVAEGLLGEAKMLYDHYQGAQSTLGIGYKEFFPYFEGQEDLENCVNLVKQHSRNYAKRQLTWFKNRMATEWYDVVQEPDNVNKITKMLEEWVK